MMEKRYTRNEISKLLRIGNETLRYYEKVELIPLPDRSQSRYRLYSDDDLLRLKFIKRLKELGFNLNEIASVLHMLNHDKMKNKEVLKNQIAAKIVEIDQKVSELNALKEILYLSKDNPGLGECDYLNLFYKNS